MNPQDMATMTLTLKVLLFRHKLVNHRKHWIFVNLLLLSKRLQQSVLADRKANIKAGQTIQFVSSLKTN
jgi:hypothetical protein